VRPCPATTDGTALRAALDQPGELAPTLVNNVRDRRPFTELDARARTLLESHPWRCLSWPRCL
jgi:hypothetical protein